MKYALLLFLNKHKKIFAFLKIFTSKIKDKNNTFVLIKANGKKIYNPKIKNLKVKFEGINNYLEINETLWLGNKLQIRFLSNNGKLKIGKDCQLAVNGKMNWYVAQNSSINIGNYVSVGKALITTSKSEGCSINIGESCLLSYDLIIRTSDVHTIYDKNTQEILNKNESINIGNHVWIAPRAVISKGSSIPDDCIVGLGSFVDKKFDETNCIIAGTPAKIVKRNINWEK